MGDKGCNEHLAGLSCTISGITKIDNGVERAISVCVKWDWLACAVKCYRVILPRVDSYMLSTATAAADAGMCAAGNIAKLGNRHYT